MREQSRLKNAPAVVAGRVGQSPDVAAVAVHPVKLEVVVARRGEDDGAIARAHGGLGVVALLGRQAGDAGAVGGRLEDVVAVVERPDVALAHVGPGRAGGPARGGWRRRPDRPTGGNGRRWWRPGPRRPAPAAPGLGQDRHPVDAIAALGRLAGLERELGAVEGPVGLGVFPAEGQLLQILEVGALVGQQAGLGQAAACAAQQDQGETTRGRGTAAPSRDDERHGPESIVRSSMPADPVSRRAAAARRRRPAPRPACAASSRGPPPLVVLDGHPGHQLVEQPLRSRFVDREALPAP